MKVNKSILTSVVLLVEFLLLVEIHESFFSIISEIIILSIYDRKLYSLHFYQVLNFLKTFINYSFRLYLLVQFESLTFFVSLSEYHLKTLEKRDNL